MKHHNSLVLHVVVLVLCIAIFAHPFKHNTVKADPKTAEFSAYCACVDGDVEAFHANEVVVLHDNKTGHEWINVGHNKWVRR